MPITTTGTQIASLTNPKYSSESGFWEKWRDTYKSGDDFIDKYLQKFSSRETDADFAIRKEISYVPAFAKAAVNEVLDSIFQRISDVTRGGGPASYSIRTKGLEGGVDLAGTTMNSFIGMTILPELLTMKKVGVFVDMPRLGGETLSAQQQDSPYIYHYPVECILNWEIDPKDNKTYSKLLLKDNIFIKDEMTGLPIDTTYRYRYMWLEDGKVKVKFYNAESQQVNSEGLLSDEVVELNIPIIPFVLFEISDSLLADVANYQITLLNMASSDVLYSLKSNFPFYVEQFDPRADNLYRSMTGFGQTDTDGVVINPGEQANADTGKNYEVQVGSTTGRRFPKGLELPSFIHPSAEPLLASMQKQEELKRDILTLVKLSVASLGPKMASAESKGFDERSLEAGLSAIGLVLEQGERLIAKYWQLYVGEGDSDATVNYPQKYSLQSDKDKRDEAKDLIASSKVIPSVKFKKEALKEAATISLGSKLTNSKLNEILEEIDNADVVVNPDELNRDIELGLIDLEAASKAKGYPKNSVCKAKTDHAERIARIAESQAKARGTDELGGIANASRSEKLDKDCEPVAVKKTRGEAE